MTKIRFTTDYRCHVCDARFTVYHRAVRWIGRRRISRDDPEACPRCRAPLRYPSPPGVNGVYTVLLLLAGDSSSATLSGDLSATLRRLARTPAELEALIDEAVALDLDAWARLSAVRRPGPRGRALNRYIARLRRLRAEGTMRGRLERAADPLLTELLEEHDRHSPDPRPLLTQTRSLTELMAALPYAR